MRRHSGYLFGCCGAVFAVASFVIGLEVSATTAAPSLQQHPAPVVNRALKSDRQRIIPAPSRNAVNDTIEMKSPTTPKLELLDGCEPMISTIGQSPLARIPGRCVS